MKDYSDKPKFTVASFFAGVGGIDLGLQQTGCFETIYANELDKYAAQTFEANFPIKVDVRDIKEVEGTEFEVPDLICAGFPCQPYSIAGMRKGLEDERGKVVFELLRIIRIKKPKVILLENVRNLLTHNKGETINYLLSLLEDAGYSYCKFKVIAGDDFNVPQHRERLYIVGFRDERMFDAFEFPQAVPLTTKFKDIYDYNTLLDEKYYYRQGKYKSVVSDYILEKATDPDRLYLLHFNDCTVRASKPNISHTLCASMADGGHRIPCLLTKHGVRKLTPREVFSTMGFPADFVLPEMSNNQLYRQAGNSVCVGVIKHIGYEIEKVLRKFS